jgi:hypothetical protein
MPTSPSDHLRRMPRHSVSPLRYGARMGVQRRAGGQSSIHSPAPTLGRRAHPGAGAMSRVLCATSRSWEARWLRVARAIGNEVSVLPMTSQMACADPHGLSRCSSCNQPYTPVRRPQANRNHYCEPCFDGADLASKNGTGGDGTPRSKRSRGPDAARKAREDVRTERMADAQTIAVRFI